LIFKDFPNKQEKAHYSCIPESPVGTLRKNTCLTPVFSRVFGYAVMLILLLLVYR